MIVELAQGGPVPDEVLDFVGDLFGDAVSAAGDAVTTQLDAWLVSLVAGPIEWLTNHLVNHLNSITYDVNTINGFPLRNWLMGLGLFVVALLFFAEVVRSTLTGRIGDMARTVLHDVPAAIVWMAGAFFFTDQAVRFVDAFTAAVVGDVPTAVATLGAAFATAAPTGPNTNVLLFVLFGFLYVMAGLMLMIELYARAGLLYFVLIAAPGFYATRSSARWRSIATRFVELTIALVLSKLVIGIFLAIAARVILAGSPGGPGDTGWTALIIGSALFLLASFSPFMILRVLPLTAGGLDGAGRASTAPVTSAAASGVRTAATVYGISRAVSSPGGSGSSPTMSSSTRPPLAPAAGASQSAPVAGADSSAGSRSPSPAGVRAASTPDGTSGGAGGGRW